MVDGTVKRQREMGALGKDAAVQATLAGDRAAMLVAIGATAKARG
jgi:hypothetical protein